MDEKCREALREPQFKAEEKRKGKEITKYRSSISPVASLFWTYEDDLYMPRQHCSVDLLGYRSAIKKTPGLRTCPGICCICGEVGYTF